MDDLKAQKLLLTSQRRLQWMTETLPALGAYDVLVQTRTGAMSIGSELPLYCGTARTGEPLQYPHATGYESVGIVRACGPHVQTLHPGDRVVAFYGHCTHAVVPESNVIAVPDAISDALAILVILTCDAAKGVRKIVAMPEEAFLITGAGAMGLLTLFILNAYGCTSVDMVEPQQYRHTLASQLGARKVFFPQDLPPASEAYAAGFECSSRNDGFVLLQKQMQHNGRICITADGNFEPLVLTPEFHTKELKIVASSDGWDYHRHAAWYFQRIQQEASGLELLFESEITHKELVPEFEELAKSRSMPVKVLVHYEG